MTIYGAAYNIFLNDERVIGALGIEERGGFFTIRANHGVAEALFRKCKRERLIRVRVEAANIPSRWLHPIRRYKVLKFVRESQGDYIPKDVTRGRSDATLILQKALDMPEYAPASTTSS